MGKIIGIIAIILLLFTIWCLLKTEFVTWNNKTEGSATINGKTGLTVYTVSDGTITIKGTLADFLGKDANNSALPLSFYAASKVTKGTDGKLVESPAKLDVDNVSLYKYIDIAGFSKEIDLSFTGKELSSNMGGMRVGFDLPNLGLFKENLSNLVILDETDNYYYIDEAKANLLIKAAGVDVEIQTFRNAIFSYKRDAWIKLYSLVEILAPGQFAENRPDGKDTSLVELLDILVGDIFIVSSAARAAAGVAIQSADITIILKTTGDAVCWGLNVQSADTDISKTK